MADTTPFTWGDITLSQVVDIDGTPHITKQAIGEWLEYIEPRKAGVVIFAVSRSQIDFD